MSSPCPLPLPALVNTIYSGAPKSCKAALWFDLLCMKEVSPKCVQALSMCNNCFFRDASFLSRVQAHAEMEPWFAHELWSVLVAIAELAGV